MLSVRGPSSTRMPADRRQKTMNVIEGDQSKLCKQHEQIPQRVHTRDACTPSLTEPDLLEL